MSKESARVQHAHKKVKVTIFGFKNPVVQHQDVKKRHKEKGRTNTSCSSTEVSGIKPDSKKTGKYHRFSRLF